MVVLSVITLRFCCSHPHISQGRGSVRGKPLRVSPLAFNRPPAGDHFCVAKVLLQKRKTPRMGVFLFWSGRRGSTRYRHPTNGRAIRRSPAGPLDLTRFAPVEAASSSLPATFQKENTILTDGVSFCDYPQVLLFVRLAYRKKRNEARLATGIPRMAEPFVGALPDLSI